MRARSSPCRAARKCVAPSRELQIARDPEIVAAESVGLHGTKRLGHHAAHRGAFAPANDAPAPRHQIHQPPELQLDGGEVGVNIGVIEFERGDDQIVGAVVQKLRALVEKRGIVLVALDDELLAAAQSIALAEVFRHAADQEIGPAPRHLKDPSQQGSGGGFAVRAGHHQRIVSRQEKLLDRFGKRAIGNLVVEDELEFGIAARDGVADDHQVRPRREIRFGEPVFPANAQFFEQRGGGRVDARVRAAHAIAAFGQHPRQRRHGRAANADQVDGFDVVVNHGCE